MLNQEQRRFLLQAARRAILDYLENGLTGVAETADPVLIEKRGAFVTLRREKDLRGCIGLIEGKYPLNETVCRMAIEAAVGDPRFPGLVIRELKEVTIEISVLTTPERVRGPEEIVMLRDGVIVRQGYCQGVFLPQVAEEQGWNKEQFLSFLCEYKAGLPREAWKAKETELYTFQAEVFSEADFPPGLSSR